MTTESAWERLKKTRPFRVLGVYVAASWVVLQGVGTLRELVTLPDWIGPATLILLAVGLVVVGATAWLQSLSETTAAEARGEIPSDWEIAPRDVIASLRAGRLPHLTWARVLVGGMVSLSLMVGAAGIWMLVSARDGTPGAGSTEAPSAIAVLPFTVSGPDLDLYREGMVSLVSTNIDGVQGFRSVSPRSVIAEWRGEFGDESNVPEDGALGIARSVGARFALLGDATQVGETLRLTGELFDLESGEAFPVGRSEGPQEEILGLVDQMSVNTLRALLEERGSPAELEIQRLDGMVTASIPALNAYLEGEARYRQADYAGAINAFERAVAADSTFAMAWSKLAGAWSWTANPDFGVLLAAQERALSNATRLPAREITLLRVLADLNLSSLSGARLEELREYVRRYPDDPTGWNLLFEYLWHLPVRGTLSELEMAMRQPLELEPSGGIYYAHMMPLLAARGDTADFDRYLELARDAGLQRVVLFSEAAWAMVNGTPEEKRAARQTLRELPDLAQTVTEVAYYSPTVSVEEAIFMTELLPATDQGRALLRFFPRASRGVNLPDPSGPEEMGVSRSIAALIALENGMPPAPPSDQLSGDSLVALLDRSIPGDATAADGFSEARVILRDALRLLGDGEPARALARLDEIPDDLSVTGVGDPAVLLFWSLVKGQALAMLGDLEGALWFATPRFGTFGLQWLRVGELHEALGDPASARAAYEAFLQLYSEADESAAPLLRRGEDGLRRVGG